MARVEDIHPSNASSAQREAPRFAGARPFGRRPTPTWVLCLVGLGLSACESTRAGTALTTRTPSEVSSEGAADDAESDANGIPESLDIRPGDAHRAAIVGGVFSPDGSAAVSIDAQGGIRIWTGLDGDTPNPPRALPGPAARRMAVASTPNGWVVALVDASGGARVVDVSKTLEVETRFEVAPSDPLEALLPHDGAFVALAADRSVRWLDASGAVEGRWTGRRFPAEEVQIAAGEIWVRARGKQGSEVVHEFRRLVRDARGELIEGGDPLEMPVRAGALAWDLERARVWTFESSASVETVLYRLDLHGDSTRDETVGDETADTLLSSWKIPRSMNQLTRLGIDARGAPIFEIQALGAYRFDVEQQRMHGLPIRVDGPAFVHWSHGRRLSAFAAHLGVEDSRQPERSARYLGFATVSGHFAAVDPKGRHIAWSSHGRLAVESVADGQLRVFPRPLDASPMGLAWVGEGRIVTASWNGTISMLDARTGAPIDEMDAGGNLSEIRVSAEGDALTWKSQLWGTRNVATVGPDGFGRRFSVVDSAAFAGAFMDGGALSMWTFDGVRARKRSEAQFTAGDSWVVESSPPTAPTGTASESSVAAAPDETGKDDHPWGMERPDTAAQFFSPGTAGGSLWLLRALGPEPQPRLWQLDARGERVFESKLSGGNPVWLIGGPQRSKVIAVVESSAQRRMHVFDLEHPDASWSAPIPRDAFPSWSADGSRILAHGQSGGAVLYDARGGDVVHARCNFEFEVRSSPPAMTMPMNVPDACAG